MDDLRRVCPRLDLFDLVVAENGALLYRPGDGWERVLAAPPPAAFLDALKARGVTGFSVGRVVVAAWEPDAPAVESAVAALGLDWRVVRNKRALMVLPAGVDKASGLAEASAGSACRPRRSLRWGTPRTTWPSSTPPGAPRPCPTPCRP